MKVKYEIDKEDCYQKIIKKETVWDSEDRMYESIMKIPVRIPDLFFLMLDGMKLS